MNFLAHARLSFNNPSILTGNLISDFVKGKSQYDYSVQIHKGILLHRRIDNFTDKHISIKEMSKIFKQHYGMYAGVFVDVVLDYFLANDVNEFADELMLHNFSQETYQHLNNNFELLPVNFQPVFLGMQKHNWLFNYKHNWGIQKSFSHIAYRAKYINESEIAFELFENNLEELKLNYDIFFPQVKEYAAKELIDLLNNV